MSLIQRHVPISLPCTGEEEWQAVREPIMSGWLTQGSKVAAFEQAFAEYHGVKHALATSSCTTGLHLILAAMGIGPGDEVIVPAFTWVATANVVLYCGATPVFADVIPDTYNIDPNDVKRKLSPKTRAVIAVHLFGLCADVEALISILPSDVKLIEDAACAAGAVIKNTFAGSLADAAAFSFHPRKSITTGEGGMVTTNDKQLAETMDKLRNHGAEVSEEQRHHGAQPYIMPEFNLLGFNYRMTDLQGAVGLTQLSKLNEFILARQIGAEYYFHELEDIKWLRMPILPEDGKHAWQAFVTYIDPDTAPMPRNEMMKILQSKGVSTRPGTHAVHMLAYYKTHFNIQADDYPIARNCNDNTMAIPLHNRMLDEDYSYVVEAIKGLA